MIRSVRSSANSAFKILGILYNHAHGSVSVELKQSILDEMKATGSFAYTYAMLERILGKLKDLLRSMKVETKVRNERLEQLLGKLMLARVLMGGEGRYRNV